MNDRALRPGLAALALVAGVCAGALTALLDIGSALVWGQGSYSAGSWVAAFANVLVIDISIGLVAGVAVILFATTAFGPGALSTRAREATRLVASILRASDRERELARVATILGATMLTVLAVVALVGLFAWALPKIAGDPLAAIPVGIVTALIVATALASVRLASRATGRAMARLPNGLRERLTTRALLLATLMSAAVVTAIYAHEVHRFFKAAGAAPLVLGAVAVAAATTFAVAIASGSFHRLATLASSRRQSVMIAVAVLALWIGVAPWIGQTGSAVFIYRVEAPLAARGAVLFGRILDFDRDGYSQLFGDGDCAPWDASRGPGQREIPQNGIDEDCLDGDATTGRPRPPKPAARPIDIPGPLSFVVIMVDALRWDHIHAAGYHRETTPNIDRLIDESAVFTRAYSPSSYTHPSVSAIMTSRMPSDLPRAFEKKAGVPADAPTLARELARAGYATGYLGDYGSLAANAGFETGFSDVRVFGDKAKRVTNQAIRLIKRYDEQRFFLWVTYFAPHAPYRGHPDLPRFGSAFVDHYDQEILHTDREIGRLLAALDKGPLRDRTVIALIADHGEAFGEHGTYNHGLDLHEETVRVPFVLRVPGVQARWLRSAPVSLLDLYPTLLNLAGVEIPDGAVGHDQTRALVTGEQATDRVVFVESDYHGHPFSPGYQAAVVSGSNKLIYVDAARAMRLFDLASDPGELDDLASERPQLTRQLYRKLKEFQRTR